MLIDTPPTSSCTDDNADSFWPIEKLNILQDNDQSVVVEQAVAAQ